MIRPIQRDEIYKLVEIGHCFYKEGAIPGEFKDEIFIKNWEALLDAGIGAIWGAFKEDKLIGTLGCAKYADLNDGATVVTETFWFMKEEWRNGIDGIRLFKHFEKWAESIGAKRIIMVHLNNLKNKKLEPFFIKRGYSPIETHYLKEV